MRLLVDRCVGRRVVEALQSDGHDIFVLATEGLNPPDHEILALAVEFGRVVITEDLDFGTHVFRDRLPSAGVIRVEQDSPAAQLAAVRSILDQHAERLAAGDFVTFRRGRIRVTAIG